MKFKLGLMVFITILVTNLSFAQETIKGHIYESEAPGHKHPLPGANVYWQGTTEGTSTNLEGYFEIEKHNNTHRYLVISYVGFMNDTIDLKTAKQPIDHILETTKELNEVVINAKASGTHVSHIDPIYKEVITSGELQKAACCNLAESFETNASVDVSYNDAITGAKQIQLLGLSGLYSQIMTENIPLIKGPAIPYGLGYVPGTWMESIQISKGTSSVINGYESITGQINAEYKKPENTDKFFLNLYGNDVGRMEGSAIASAKINEHFHTMVLTHGELNNNRIDFNKDGFLDQPLVKKYNIMNRYKYDKPGVIESMFGFKVMYEDRLAGENNYKKNKDEIFPLLYGVDIKTHRYEAFAKNGFFLKKKGSSIGTILSGTYHDQNSMFGLNTYDIIYKNLYANIIYETGIIDEHHKLNTGASFTYDSYKEIVNNTSSSTEELVPGIFGQYTYTNHDHFTLIAGIRYDNHNIFGHFITPRLHIKYKPAEKITIRASVGKGYRSPHIYAENNYILMTSRNIILEEKLKAEEAWNMGGSIVYDFELFGQTSDFSIEFYRTVFSNQIVFDQDMNPLEVHIYNLRGESYSNSAQAVFNTEIMTALTLTAAYRLSDVKTTINDVLVQKPLVNRYKGLITISYLTPNNKWQFDFTTQFNGKSRLPDTDLLPEAYRKPDQSPAYQILNTQITYKAKAFEFYLGGENLSSFTQKDPIISAGDPFGNYFDASMVWGPIMPRMFYLGVRYSIK